MYLHVDDGISTHHTPPPTASLGHNHFPCFSTSFCLLSLGLPLCLLTLSELAQHAA